MIQHEYIAARGRELGLNRFLLQASKKVLVHAIQRAEGHAACFLADNRFMCQETGCEWRSECLTLKAAWRR
jgi:hypothetical protein